jgi:hypothetical protein
MGFVKLMCVKIEEMMGITWCYLFFIWINIGLLVEYW